MISVEAATELIQKNRPGFGLTEVSVSQVAGGLLAEDLLSDREYPPINRAMMDGIAVSFAQYQTGQREFAVLGAIAAGDPPQKLKDPHSCFEIMTGAAVPEGADLIVQYEHLEFKDGKAFVVNEVPRSPHDSIHLKGSDCAAGARVLKSGVNLNGPHWGIAASMGYKKIKIKKNPKIMIISTGDELVDVEAAPLPHQLRRSNAFALKASLLAAGYTEVVLDHLSDDAEAVAAHYQKNTAYFDILIYSGGVSRGKFDHLPSVWADLGVKKYFHEVSQRPGKPLWFGVDEKNQTTVFGLPGNPVSSLVCLHRYVIPSPKMWVKLTAEFIFKKDLTYFLPVKLHFNIDATVSASPLRYQNSGEFTALAESDGFIELPKDRSIFAAGEVFPFFAWKV